ncbi:hypothetical protein PpBr36_04453 [Pyricularia pennisetigena]|uniref:hypothetical protein n=1 Tax=Pyricularia pennisetigena TaxID=1578925 RepID=UPI00114E6603|nr:hypothetical protein PpBr36_04453 [Pyricularia pennisetigena]TLS27411.1 hypothetical protein PpBr36_04453 [Pyricularia pennisetigena]
MLAILSPSAQFAPRHRDTQASTGPSCTRSDLMTGFLKKYLLSSSLKDAVIVLIRHDPDANLLQVRQGRSITHSLLYTLRMRAAVLSFLAFKGHIDTFYVLFPLFCNSSLHGLVHLLNLVADITSIAAIRAWMQGWED